MIITYYILHSWLLRKRPYATKIYLQTENVLEGQVIIEFQAGITLKVKSLKPLKRFEV